MKAVKEWLGIWWFNILRDETGCRIYLYNEMSDSEGWLWKTKYFKSIEPIGQFNCFDIGNLEYTHNCRSLQLNFKCED